MEIETHGCERENQEREQKAGRSAAKKKKSAAAVLLCPPARLKLCVFAWPRGSWLFVGSTPGNDYKSLLIPRPLATFTPHPLSFSLFNCCFLPFPPLRPYPRCLLIPLCPSVSLFPFLPLVQRNCCSLLKTENPSSTTTNIINRHHALLLHSPPPSDHLPATSRRCHQDVRANSKGRGGGRSWWWWRDRNEGEVYGRGVLEDRGGEDRGVGGGGREGDVMEKSQ